MTSPGYASWFRSPWAQSLIEQGRDEVREEAREEVQQARDEATEALTNEHRQTVLRTLEIRGIEVSPTVREIIETQSNLNVLGTWVDRAYEITRVEGLFADL